MPKKPITKEQKSFRFYRRAPGHLVLAAIIWVIGYTLFLHASDTGSLLQWGIVGICLFWGLYHVGVATALFSRKLWRKQNKSV